MARVSEKEHSSSGRQGTEAKSVSSLSGSLLAEVAAETHSAEQHDLLLFCAIDRDMVIRLAVAACDCAVPRFRDCILQRMQTLTSAKDKVHTVAANQTEVRLQSSR